MKKLTNTLWALCPATIKAKKALDKFAAVRAKMKLQEDLQEMMRVTGWDRDKCIYFQYVLRVSFRDIADYWKAFKCLPLPGQRELIILRHYGFKAMQSNKALMPVKEIRQEVRTQELNESLTN